MGCWEVGGVVSVELELELGLGLGLEVSGMLQ
jgi:hypothetical protein